MYARTHVRTHARGVTWFVCVCVRRVLAWPAAATLVQLFSYLRGVRAREPMTCKIHMHALAFALRCA